MLNRRLAYIHFAALLVIWSLPLPAAARSASSNGSPAVADSSSIRIDNFGRINPNYYRGAQPRGRDYADLAALGVKTVIDLTGDDGQPEEKRMAETAGMAYVRFPMTTHTPPSAETVSQFLKILDDPARLPVYVHCVGGRHRTGVMTAAYRMSHEGWSADQAFAEMKRYKFGADFLHSEFKAFVYGYHPTVGDNAARLGPVATKAGN